MKQLKLFLSVACAVAIVAPAFATKLTVSGGGNLRYGYDSNKVGSASAVTSSGMKRDGDFFKITFAVASDDDKFTGAGQVRFYSGNAGDQGEGWAQYDFGTVAVKYSANGEGGAWDNDLKYIHDESSGVKQNLNFAIKASDQASVFVTLIQVSPDTNNYINKKERTIPVIQVGANITAGAVSATVGGAFDSHKAAIAAQGETKKAVGLLIFGKATFKASDALSAFVSGAYGSASGTFAAENNGDAPAGWTNAKQTASIAKKPTVTTARAGVDFAIDADNTVGGQFKYALATLSDTSKWTGFLGEAYVKHAFSPNFATKLGFDYGQDSQKLSGVTTKIKDTQVWLNVEYSF
jgi:hypothetical protein